MPATLRTDAEALIKEEVSQKIIGLVETQSVAMKLFNNVPMSKKITRQPVLASLAVAAWVNPSDTGFKTVSKARWENKYLTAEPIAVILPVPDDVLADADYDLWKLLETEGSRAIAQAFDATVFNGVNKPASFPAGLVQQAVAAGNVVTRGTASKANGGVAEDINQMMGMVEADGFDVTGFAANRRFRSIARGARDLNGQKLIDTSGDASMIEGLPVEYLRGILPVGVSAPELLCGDFEQAIIGVRSDITMKVLDQASLYNADGTLMYALAQQDMTAIRLVARYAFVVANSVTVDNLVEANRFPFAVLNSPAV